MSAAATVRERTIKPQLKPPLFAQIDLLPPYLGVLGCTMVWHKTYLHTILAAEGLYVLRFAHLQTSEV